MAHLTNKPQRVSSLSTCGTIATGFSKALLIFAALGLSACVSSVARLDENSETKPSETQLALTSSQADVGAQNLVQTQDGSTIAVPTRYPVAPVKLSADLAPGSSNTVEGTVESENEILVHAQTPASDNNVAKETALDTASPQVTSDPQVTSELALVIPQPNPIAQSADPNAAKETASTLSVSNTQQLNATKLATENQATKELNRPSFLARLFKRPPQNVGAKDDRKNPILVSSQTASASSSTLAPARASLSAMPGVRSNDDIFGIKRNLGEAQDRVQLASAAGIARLSPSKLTTQHSGVNVTCIRPEILQLIDIIERKYGKNATVTSGYRSPSRNRRAGGARNSMHIYCKAVDIQVEGVSKWNLAKYIRTIPGRGGVGTYCRTKSVHIDIGPKRDWHYSCRRKSKRKRKA